MHFLSSAARKDNVDIGCFTTEKWGKPQGNGYLKQFDDIFRLLARQHLLDILAIYKPRIFL